MNSILVVGAGREGKGYLGNVFEEGGWKVAFLDKDPKVVAELRKGQFQVMEYRAKDTRRRIVREYQVFSVDDEPECREFLISADVAALCLYPADMREAVEYILPILKERAQINPAQKLSILPCTNEGGLIPVLEKQIRDALNVGERRWFEQSVLLSDTVVRRPVGAPSNYSLCLEAGVVCPMLVGTPVYADFTGVPWIKTTTEDIELLKELKVHTINTAHAATAYAGYLKGYQTIDEAAADPEIRAIRDGVLEEAVPVLSEVYGVPLKELWELAVFPESKEAFSDPITRVAFDPIRKLSRHDRLTANACLCLERGAKVDDLLQSIANGMAYDASGDPAAAKIQGWIKEEGIAKAVSRVTGLPEDHELVLRVSVLWNEIAHRTRKGRSSHGL